MFAFFVIEWHELFVYFRDEATLLKITTYAQIFIYIRVIKDAVFIFPSPKVKEIRELMELL